MSKGFIKNYSLIQEDSKVDDLLDFTASTIAFANKLEGIDGPAIIGLVGPFGVGKSTMLHQLSIKRTEKETWINFDAWKYPERSDLWEGFVLDLADQIGDRKKVKKRIEGKETKSQVLDIATDVVSELSDRIPNLNFLDKIKEIFKTSPAKRVFEIQEILKEILNKQPRGMCITIEDIDRSGDAGIFFLETLKQFMREAALKNNVKIIVPISENKYWEYRDSYYKCLDYKVDFLPKIG